MQTVQNAVTMLCRTEQLIGSLPEVKWAQQVRSLATELQEESLRVIVQHFPKVTDTQAFKDLCIVSWWSSHTNTLWFIMIVWKCNKKQPPYLSLCLIALQREEFTREPTLLKKLCSAIREGVTVDNCCDLFTAVHSLCEDDFEEDFCMERRLQQLEEVKWVTILLYYCITSVYAVKWNFLA